MSSFLDLSRGSHHVHEGVVSPEQPFLIEIGDVRFDIAGGLFFGNRHGRHLLDKLLHRVATLRIVGAKWLTLSFGVDGDAGPGDAQIDRLLVLGIVGVNDKLAVLDFESDLSLGSVRTGRVNAEACGRSLLDLDAPRPCVDVGRYVFVQAPVVHDHRISPALKFVGGV